MQTFSIFGASGYIAPRHIRAMKALDLELVAILDPNEPQNELADHFPHVAVFKEIEAFESFFITNPTDYITICSPNHLHKQHVEWALKHGAHVICEKPLVLDPIELDHLHTLEKQTGCNVYTVLQLRFLDEMQRLKEQIDTSSTQDHIVDIQHITPRNEAYFSSWKGDPALSGGIITNIGIHLFDLLIWIFGNVQSYNIQQYAFNKAKGQIKLERAQVNWLLSVDAADLPVEGNSFFRKLWVNKEEISLEKGLEELYTRFYTAILNKKAPGIEAARPSIVLCNQLICSNPQ